MDVQPPSPLLLLAPELVLAIGDEVSSICATRIIALQHIDLDDSHS